MVAGFLAAIATDVDLETAQGRLRLSGMAREEKRGGTKFLIVRISRTMIPSRSGTFEIPPASLVADEATRWQRDFFDHVNAGATFGAMAQNGQLSGKMLERMKQGSKMPGWVKREEFDWYETLADREA